MSRIVEMISTPEWLISVLVVGVGTNLIAAYVKPWLDRWLSSISTRHAETQRRIGGARARLVHQLAIDPVRLLVHCHLGNLAWIRAYAHLTLGGLFGVISKMTGSTSCRVIGLSMSLLIFILGLISLTAATACGQEVRAALAERDASARDDEGEGKTNGGDSGLTTS